MAHVYMQHSWVMHGKKTTVPLVLSFGSVNGKLTDNDLLESQC